MDSNTQQALRVARNSILFDVSGRCEISRCPVADPRPPMIIGWAAPTTSEGRVAPVQTLAPAAPIPRLHSLTPFPSISCSHCSPSLTIHLPDVTFPSLLLCPPLQSLNAFLPGGGAANLSANTGWHLKTIWRQEFTNESLFYDPATADGEPCC